MAPSGCIGATSEKRHATHGQGVDTPAYTQAAYDGLGRVTSITDSDGVSSSTYSYVGNATTVSDEASKQRKLVVDAIGRIEQVYEPDGSNNLTLETDYQYDQNQTSGSGSPKTYQTIVTQKGGSSSSSDWRVRTFTYDTLGRMVSSATQEAGIINYTYPMSGSFCAADLTLTCTRTDSNSTTTTYVYDTLSRLTGKTYSGSTIATNTASVSYSYDQTSFNGLAITNSNGLLTGMSDGSGATAWSYDGLGNVKAVRKTINSVTKEADYNYNADSTPSSMTDFGGTTFTYSYDIAGHQTQISDGFGNTYAASALYNAAGQLTSVNHQLTLGGGAYARSWQYNSRLQPSVISATLNGNTIQSLSYGYGTGGTNNGNILAVTNGMSSSRNQTLTYDNLNRLQSAKDASHWGETYTYDNWGNLYQTTRMSGYSGGNNWSLSAPGSNNHLSNQSYDSAGEVTTDQYSNTYSYDAEGRILSGGSGTYVYDGAGNRVKKTASSTTTLYWPGVGPLLDESNSSGTTFAKQVNFAGLLVWSESVSSGGRFLFQDHLGSTRVTGDASGNPGDDIDYLPFGSIASNFGTSSGAHYTFTGYESDQSEDSTDYAIFRNLNTAMGRFNRPDPYDGSYDPTNPQSLNRYSYVMNSPSVLIDPLGLLWTCNWVNQQTVYWDGVIIGESGGYYICQDDGSFRGGGNGPGDGGGRAGGGRSGGGGGSGSSAANRGCKTGFGAGITIGGDAGVGLGAVGAGANGSVGAGLFGGNGINAGAYASGGAGANFFSHAASAVKSIISPNFVGAGGGAGVGIFLTNASQASQLRGPFATWNVDLGWLANGSAQLAQGTDASGNTIYTFSFQLGGGGGFLYHNVTTTTVAKGTGKPGC